MNMYFALGLIFLIILIIYIYIWIRKKKFTRERYAFFATSLVFTYAMTVMTHILADVSLLNIFTMLFNNLPYEDIPISSTSWPAKAWSVAFLIILSIYVYFMFEAWGLEGAVSKLDDRKREVMEDLGFLHAAFLGMQPSKIEIVDEGEKNNSAGKEINYELCYLDQSRDWPSETRELLRMYAQQYNLKENEWYKDKECFLSTYITQPLLVICSKNSPSDESVLEKINFFNQLSNGKTLKVVLSVKEAVDIDLNRQVGEFKLECFSKDFLLRNLVNFSDYNDYLHSQFYENEISEGDLLKLDDIYVESEGIITDLREESGEEKRIKSVESYLMSWAKGTKNEEQIALLGDYGQGKSVLSLKFANELVASEIDRQPIIIELRGKSPRNMAIGELVAAWAFRFNYDVKAILTLLQEGHLVVILEGFDELDMVGDKLRRLEHFKKLWEFARYEKSKVVITGRPNLFLNNSEAREYLQIGSGNSSTFHVKALKLEPFTRCQIELALRNSSSEISKQILQQYDISKKGIGFSDLISRPSTLFQTSIIWDTLEKTSLNSSRIINSFIEHAYKRQAQKLLAIGGSDLESPVLTAKERGYFMLGIAVGMVDKGGYSNQISGNELEDIVFRLFISIPKTCSDDHHSSTLRLTERLESDPFESVYNDVRTAGILVRDLTSYDSFKFAHKSFLECLFANFMKDKISPETVEIEKISNTIIKSLRISDVYTLDFNDEVIGHITENIVRQGQCFGDKEASSLIKVLSSKAIVLDTIFYRKKFKVSIWMLISLISTILFYMGIRLPFENSTVTPILVSFIVFIGGYFNFYLPGMWLASIATRRLDSVLQIWKRACEVQGYELGNEKIISQLFMNVATSKEKYSSFFERIFPKISIKLKNKDGESDNI